MSNFHTYSNMNNLNTNLLNSLASSVASSRTYIVPGGTNLKPVRFNDSTGYNTPIFSVIRRNNRDRTEGAPFIQVFVEIKQIITILTILVILVTLVFGSHQSNSIHELRHPGGIASLLEILRSVLRGAEDCLKHISHIATRPDFVQKHTICITAKVDITPIILVIPFKKQIRFFFSIF